MNLENCVTSFQICNNLFRGSIVRLSSVAFDIINRHNYPTALQSLLSETLALTASIGSKIKDEGVFTFQAKGDGTVSTLFSDIDHNFSLRGYISYKKEKKIDISNTIELLGNGHLAFTIKEGRYSNNYQGIVNLEGKLLKDSVEKYFNSSEQLETIFKTFNAYNLTKELNLPSYLSGAIMLQKLPELKKDDFNINVDEIWNEAVNFLNTIEDKEFLDTNLTSKDLLYRIFGQLEIGVLREVIVNSNCRCSDKKIINLFKTMEEKDLKAIFKNKDVTEVVCEFCKIKRTFSKNTLLSQAN